MSAIEQLTKPAHLIDMEDIIREGHPTLRLKAQEATAQDHWRRIDGAWHHVLRRSSTLPDAKP